MASKKQETDGQIQISPLQTESLELFLVGDSSLILNCMAEKARRDLLAPHKKTAADKATNIKHDPMAEFLSSPHTLKDPKSPTLLALPAAAPKKAMMTAALETSGTNKTQIGRLAWVTGEYLGVYGVPTLIMSVVKSADMNRTPDIRTRCAIREWAIRIRINYVTPTLNPTSIWTLLTNAGLIVGVGDWRQEKGSGSHGQFRLLPLAKASEIDHILSAGRDVQVSAMENPEFYDDESAQLFDWFQSEMKVRGKAVPSQERKVAVTVTNGYVPSSKKTNGHAAIS